MKYFMGIDLGTSSVKSLLMAENGDVCGTAQKEYNISKPQIAYAEQDAEQLWEATRDTLRDLKARYPEAISRLSGISYSGQMHGLVMLDAGRKPVYNVIIWADQRSADAIETIYSKIPEDLYRKTALNSLSTGFLVSSLVWIQMHKPELFRKIDKVMLPKDYIRYRMCGELGTDMSDASGTAVFDTARRQWAWKLMDALELPRSLFVPCHEAFETAGAVTAECALETGLSEGTPIVYGGGDTLVQAVGNGMIAPGILTANIGTASQLTCTVESPLYDPQFRTNTFCHAGKNLWMILGANLSGGVSLKWLKNNILEMESYDAMTTLASTAPAGSQGLLFLPYLSGERTPWNDPEARGIYFGLSLKHNRADIIRSTMEGIVFSQKSSLEIFRNMGIHFHKIITSGGGARGKLFREIQADMFGCGIHMSLVKEQAGIGAAIIAAVGTGFYSDYQEACDRIVRFSDDVVEPDPERMKIYAERFQVFKELYPTNKDLFQQNKTTLSPHLYRHNL